MLTPSGVHVFIACRAMAPGFPTTLAIAGGDPLRLKKALIIIPASAVLMIGLNLVFWSTLR